jgi:light-regulated signal transduction histidine kinase (bacteriophytochrome)
MVVSYASLLAERYGGQLDERADRYLSYVTEGGRRMQRLVAGLLDLSQVERDSSPPEPIAVAEAVRLAMAENLDSIEMSGATVTVAGDLPTVLGHEEHLVRVFSNLISNALKFRADRPLRITVSAEPVAEGWVVSVADNGIGIAAEDVKTVFGMFQRLHTRTEYEGNGIGLALVERIVGRSGGRVWVDSELGEGSTFRVFLPVCTAGPDAAGPPATAPVRTG